MLSDLLTFRKMIAPAIIGACYWVLAVVFLLSGIVGGIYGFTKLFGKDDIQTGVLTILMAIIGTIVIEIITRFVAEVAILLFRMNETLTDIRANTAKSG